MNAESNHSLQTIQGSRSNGRPPAWRVLWLPTSIGLGFVAVFAAVLGPRILPATSVEAVPALAIALDEPVNPRQSAAAPSNESSPTTPQGEPLFQAAGWIEPEPLPIHVAALVSGVIKEVFVVEGDPVKAGQSLASLVDEDALLDLAAAEAAYQQAESQIAATRAAAAAAEAGVFLRQQQIAIAEPQAELARDRLQRLEKVDTGAIAEGDLIQARLETARREAELESAKADIPVAIAEQQGAEAELALAQARLRAESVNRDRARLMLERTRINAPVDGAVLRLLRAPGTKVMLDGDHPDSNTVAMLYQPERLQVRVDVPLNQMARVFIGQAAIIRSDLLPDQTLNGHVTSVVGEADLQRNSLQVKVRIDQPDPRLRPEMLCRVSFLNQTARPLDPAPQTTSDTPVTPTTPSQTASSSATFTILIPSAALPSDWQPDQETSVWIADPDQRARRRTVLPGPLRRDDEIQILDGVRAGEPVILNPPESLREGSRLEVNLINS